MAHDATTTMTAARAPLPTARPRLHCLTRVHPDSDHPQPIDRALVLGRSPGPGHWALDDRRTSRRHFEVAPVRGEVDAVRLTDLGSKNGTFVDGARVETAYLEPGAVIRAGDTLFVYEAVEQPADGGPPLERGVSLPLLHALHRARALAPLAVPVLIVGPTGAGKERVARLLHAASARGGSLVAVNCATFGAELLASELFGHVAGAFSGARTARDGLFVSAGGGTLFLDEIAEMPLEQQPALLRALQEGRVRPVGADRERAVDVRVVAATHRDLKAAVEAGRFRGDLYARLAGAVVRLPGLAARPADVMPLFRLFASEGIGPTPTITADAAEALTTWHWPFNVRELQHAATAARVEAGRAQVVDLEALPPDVREAHVERLRATAEPEDLPLDRPTLERALRAHDGNVSAVARALGRTRQQVYRKLELLSIDPAGFRTG